MVLRILIFGPKRDEVAGGWRKLHEEPQNLYSSPSKIIAIKSSMRLARHVACMGVNPEGKRTLRRPKGVLEDNIKMDLGEIGWDGMDYTDLAHDRDQWRALVNTVTNF
jgi:hypothetical protein